jgi:hypothetical protein
VSKSSTEPQPELPSRDGCTCEIPSTGQSGLSLLALCLSVLFASFRARRR